MIGYGSALFGQGTHGKGVMQGWVGITQPISTYYSSGVAENDGFVSVKATSTFQVFGGLTLGAYGLISATTDRQGKPDAQWFGAGVSNTTTTMQAFGYMAWDSQLVDETTWRTQTID